MIQQHFIVELDHMDAKTADQTLAMLEANHYSGVISAHSWDSPQENLRIYKLGGFMTPITDSRRSRSSPSGRTSARSATPSTTSATASDTAPT